MTFAHSHQGVPALHMYRNMAVPKPHRHRARDKLPQIYRRLRSLGAQVDAGAFLCAPISALCRSFDQYASHLETRFQEGYLLEGSGLSGPAHRRSFFKNPKLLEDLAWGVEGAR